MKTTKLRQAAKGQLCQVRLNGVCNSDPATTVLAHMGGGGWSVKRLDIHGAHCCSGCHDELDGRTRGSGWGRRVMDEALMQGVIRTQQWLYDHGYLSWEGDVTTRTDAQAEQKLLGWIK